MKVHSEPRKRIKIGQSAERRGEYYKCLVNDMYLTKVGIMRSHCLTQVDIGDIWDDRYLAYAVSMNAFGELSHTVI